MLSQEEPAPSDQPKTLSHPKSTQLLLTLFPKQGTSTAQNFQNQQSFIGKAKPQLVSPHHKNIQMLLLSKLISFQTFQTPVDLLESCSAL